MKLLILFAALSALAGSPLLGIQDKQGFPDVPKNHWAYQAVADLKQRGILEGYPVLASPQSRKKNQEGDILEVVLRYLFVTYGKQVQIYFVDVKGSKESKASFLKRFKQNTPPVVSAARMQGFRDKPTGQQGTYFLAGPVKWKDRTHVEVFWHWINGIRSGMGGAYRLERQKGQWKVLGVVPGTMFRN